MAYTGSSARKGYFFQASGIWKGREIVLFPSVKEPKRANIEELKEFETENLQ